MRKIVAMTKLEKQFKNMELGILKNPGKFNEKFPDELINVTRVAKTPTFSSLGFHAMPDVNDGELKILSAAGLESKKLRRHTWTSGYKDIDDIDKAIFMRFDSWGSSRRSSVSSVQDVIEECPSDDEAEEDTSPNYDYMKCRNCNAEKYSSSKGSQKNQSLTMNYCFNCKHLFQNKLIGQIPAFAEVRRRSWTAGEKRLLSRQSSRGSLDLPSISEPSTDESANDTEEMKILVENEVERLLKFKTKSIERRKTIGCEKDFKKRSLLNKFKSSKIDYDGETEKCDERPSSLTMIEKHSISRMGNNFLL